MRLVLKKSEHPKGAIKNYYTKRAGSVGRLTELKMNTCFINHIPYSRALTCMHLYLKVHLVFENKCMHLYSNIKIHFNFFKLDKFVII